MASRVWGVVGVAALMLSFGLSARPTAAAQSVSGTPTDVLDQRRQGHDAVVRSGRRLRDAAARNGKDLAALRQILETDSTAWLDRGGRLHFVEPKLPPSIIAAAPPVMANAAPYPLAQTFLLHSMPGAQRTIYLDFTGHTVSNTGWNTNFTGGASFTAEPFDTNGSASFSNAELEIVQSVWQRVSEDYAPFAVDVTTEEPPASAITRSGFADQIYGSRAVITNTNTIYSSCGCGGISYVGMFDLASSHEAYQPSFVFQRGTGVDPKAIAEATSHEAGHALGLSHDGTTSVGYYSGHGAWAPIMGVGYARPVTQWSAGNYANANNTEDDFAVMSSFGAPLRADDAPDSVASPMALGAGPSLSVSGRITTAADVDAYSFSAAAGAATITVTPAAVSPDLDVKLSLYRNGSLVTSSDPAVSMSGYDSASGLNAVITTTLTAGTYVVTVEGTGFGDPFETGYSDYGSLGTYTLTGTIATSSASNLAPTAAVTASATSGVAPLTVSFSGAGSSDPDGSISSYQWAFSNGATASTMTASTVFTSAGTHAATLTVVDNDGATASKSVTITVDAPPPPTIRVSAITASVSGSKVIRARVRVVVVDGTGSPIAGAKVTGEFSGAIGRMVTGITAADGAVVFNSPRTTVRPASVTFAVSRVTKAGMLYSPAANTVSSASTSWA